MAGTKDNSAQKARRTRIAVAHAAGKSVTAIAKTEGLSRSWVSQELHSADTQAIVATLLDQNAEQARRTFGKALSAIENALDARKEYSTIHGIEEGGPDHFARMTAATKMLEFLKAGRPAPKPVEAQGFRPLTIQEIEQALAAAQNHKEPTSLGSNSALPRSTT